MQGAGIVVVGFGLRSMGKVLGRASCLTHKVRLF
jgi:hypothetical protein